MPRPASPRTKRLITKLTKGLNEGVAEFARSLFAATPAEDLDSLDAGQLEALSKQAKAVFGGKGTKVTVKVADDTGPDGIWHITVATPNKPFILDSVLGELAVRGADVQLVAHPVMDGRSVMAIAARVPGGMATTKMEKAIHGVVDQVTAVTEDWKPMVKRLTETVSTFRETPPPLPAPRIAEAIQFLEWLMDNNFTLMGLRHYHYEGSEKKGNLVPVKDSGLGLLRDPDAHVMTRAGKGVVMTEQIREFLFSEDGLIVTKANIQTSVHRRAYMDYIGIKLFDDDGNLDGELRLVGLFTSTAYTKSASSIPLLRHKVDAVLENFDADPTSHFGKALTNILETWPRDEMFQTDVEQLAEFAAIAAQLEERVRIRVLSRVDRFGRFVSVIAYVPRDRYDTSVRSRMGDHFADVYDGRVSAFYPAFLENGLVRVHFIIGRDEGLAPEVSRDELEATLTAMTRTWRERVAEKAGSVEGLDEVEFSSAYREVKSADRALADMAAVRALENAGEIGTDFSAPDETGRLGLRLFHLDEAIPLSRRVPLLENLGFSVIEETTWEAKRSDGGNVFIHDMVLVDASYDADADFPEEQLEDTLHAIWSGQTDDDEFNAIVLRTGLTWRTATMFRAYARYARQIRSGFTIGSMARTLAANGDIARQIASYFTHRFDPATKARGRKEKADRDAIRQALESVSSSDDDRILRNYRMLIAATLRTNYYTDALIHPDEQAGEMDTPDGKSQEPIPVPVLAFKFDCAAISIMPQPVPYREIFVSSPRVEGLHLRFGPVARGGLRWSDRAQDYRTEVLGLVKAQQVKNAVIVPVGSKGGFVPKHLPPSSDRDAWFNEGRGAYRVFIASLLSLTDNLVDGDVVPPTDMVRHDGDDPYFVVAADKGTSTFSDTANAISQSRDFWLDDAFASGGSAGYDHKKMGITARGAWEAVKRHFREMERPEQCSWDIQEEEFTAGGVGDMSGDVFGNGMLLSKKTRLIAAFDHRDIFIDPNPQDVAATYKERKRLFDKDRSSWQDYKTDLISEGGGIYSRNAKVIYLSKQAAEALDCEAGEMTPQDVMTAILKAPIDLLWFGGIGTYIRASTESNADAGDRGNDPIRITAKQVRAKVMGEGANLGLTQPARIEFNMLGGRCNSDAIDNSAGVNSSDVEVNIKIALAAAMKANKLTRGKRNTLLESMTEDVAELVLRNNYLQTLAISLSELKGEDNLAHQQRLMRSLEDRDLLDRGVEDLPDDMEIAERAKNGTPLTRAEIGVLLAYAKIVALDDLVATDVPDDDYLTDMLFGYFPEGMQKKWKAEIEGHRLRREIIGTVLANSMINRGGPTFINRVQDRTGGTIATVARAYTATRDAFDMPRLNGEIDALDAKIAGALQLELYDHLKSRVVSQTVWFARYGEFGNGVGDVVKLYGSAISKLSPKLEDIAPAFIGDRIRSEAARFQEGGVPKKLALEIARMPIAALIPDIVLAAERSNTSLDKAARAFFSITHTFRVGRIVEAARAIETADYYDGLALDRAMQSLHRARRDIVTDILTDKKAKGDADKWCEAHAEEVERTTAQLETIVEVDGVSVSMLTVAANVLADMARG
ncbi:NAD-glutamate dehydrogenase [Ahrensia sp. R2A130]|uniref:NAD-glutamate dehydrogenase n=1 Tax=Ahrensia sp. R2A130 TaxID=744979 RepID=UPI0001E08C97|nr:NAD-glutamate dehydrogenase [Ahrensia sp. R2A130]EFL88113.1 glutamate dehydrogenase [Ahrensia sp. R2A130]